MHPGDKVAVLWAYAPRAPDEFELDRGDMIKIVGIWDDGTIFQTFPDIFKFSNHARMGNWDSAE